ncbi:MAG: hypothetical protein J0L99_03295 [Chitinophagales bacterium]|nr:hypothetical protein [Chitinophagales bacterium]
MKQSIFSLVFLLFAAAQLLAQTPQLINFQAVARTANGDPKANVTVQVEFIIRENSMSGTVKYNSGAQNLQTDACGMFTAKIGSTNTADFANIDWSSGTKFLEVKADGLTIGNQQMVSVPYALYAESTRNATDQIAIIEYKVNGNGSNPGSGQTTNAGQWNKRLLNTVETNNISGNLTFNDANDIVVLQPGKYLVRAYGAANYCDGNVLRIRNTLTNVDEIYGTPGLSRSDDVDGENSYSFLEGILTVTAVNSQYVLEHWIQSNPPSGGSAIGKIFGDYPNLPTGILSTWARIVIQKIE